MPQNESEERRRFVRFPVIIASKYINLHSIKEAWANTFDISVKGVCLLTNESLPIGADLDIWLRMPDNGEQVQLKGKVVWHNLVEPRKHRVGLVLEHENLKPVPLVLRTMGF